MTVVSYQLIYDGNPRSPAISLLDLKIYLNSVISDARKGPRYMPRLRRYQEGGVWAQGSQHHRLQTPCTKPTTSWLRPCGKYSWHLDTFYPSHHLHYFCRQLWHQIICHRRRHPPHRCTPKALIHHHQLVWKQVLRTEYWLELPKNYVGISMPKYVSKALECFQCPTPKRPQYSPRKWLAPAYGAKFQYSPDATTAPKLE